MSTKIALGSSTWTISGLLPDDLRRVADNRAECPVGLLPAIRAYYVELATAILHSKIDVVELWYSSAFRDASVFEQLDRLGSVGRVASMHAPVGQGIDISSMDEAERTSGVRGCMEAAELLHKLHGKRLVIHGSGSVEDPSERGSRIAKSARSLREIADKCRGLEIDVAVELLPPPMLGNSASELIGILELIDRSNVGVCLDVNHVIPITQLFPTIRTLGERILTLHVADFDGVAERHWLPGQGSIDWKGLLQALEDIGYNGPFIYEARFPALTIDDAVFTIEQNYADLMQAAQVKATE